jgi:hypothetical protein
MRRHSRGFPGSNVSTSSAVLFQPLTLPSIKQALLAAAHECFDRFNQRPEKILSVIGSNAQKVA